MLEQRPGVIVHVTSIQRVMQMQITYTLSAADGSAIKGDVYNTIHELASPFDAK